MANDPRRPSERLRHLMQKITSSRPADVDILARLEQSLYRTDELLTPEKKRRILTQAVAEMVANLREPLYYIEQANDFEYLRQLISTWPGLPFESRMMMREAYIHIARYEERFRSLTNEDRDEFLAAMEPGPRALFIFSRSLNLRLATAIRPHLEADKELDKAPSAEAVWNTVKRLDPGMEEALRKPLDPSQFVKRDLRKTPRRSA